MSKVINQAGSNESEQAGNPFFLSEHAHLLETQEYVRMLNCGPTFFEMYMLKFGMLLIWKLDINLEFSLVYSLATEIIKCTLGQSKRGMKCAFLSFLP